MHLLESADAYYFIFFRRAHVARASRAHVAFASRLRRAHVARMSRACRAHVAYIEVVIEVS